MCDSINSIKTCIFHCFLFSYFHAQPNLFFTHLAKRQLNQNTKVMFRSMFTIAFPSLCKLENIYAQRHFLLYTQKARSQGN